MKAAVAEQYKTADQTTLICGSCNSENQHLNIPGCKQVTIFTVGTIYKNHDFSNISLALGAFNL